MQSIDVIGKTRWNIDPVHSAIAFKVKHLLFANVRGEFKEYVASIYTKDEDFRSVEVDMRINPSSISTGDVSRDAHLRGADFFNVDVFKDISFRATGLDKTGEEIYVLHGDLTMKGISRRISLDIEFDGVAKSPGGDRKAYCMVTGKINRKDWGLTWSAIMESGGAVVGEDIFIKCEIELIRATTI